MADMKFINPLKRWNVLADFMKNGGFKTLVEVGCKEGRLTGHILKNVPGSKVWAVDPWKPMPAHAGREGGETYEDWDFAAIERKFYENVEGHGNRLTMLQTTSLEAAAQLAEQGKRFDVVFIDAAHDQENVEADILAWWPLVKDGGFMTGHDYQHKFPGTMRAVAKYFPLMRVGVMPDSVWMVMKAEDIGP